MWTKVWKNSCGEPPISQVEETPRVIVLHLRFWISGQRCPKECLSASICIPFHLSLAVFAKEKQWCTPGDFTGKYYAAEERLLNKHVKRMPRFFLLWEKLRLPSRRKKSERSAVLGLLRCGCCFKEHVNPSSSADSVFSRALIPIQSSDFLIRNVPKLHLSKLLVCPESLASACFYQRHIPHLATSLPSTFAFYPDTPLWAPYMHPMLKTLLDMTSTIRLWKTQWLWHLSWRCGIS